MPSVLALVAEVSKLPGGPADSRLPDAAHYGVTLLLATSSKARIAYLREIAVKRNMTLEERLIPRRQGRRGGERRGDLQGARDAAGCRQDFAKDGTRSPARFPANCPGLSPSRILRAIRHAHTHRPTASIRWRRWQKAMLARGSEYFDVADHSKSPHYAGGLGADGSEFHIQSDESDFLTDGSEHENQASSGWVRRAFRRRDEGCTGATLRGQGFRVGMLADLVVDRLAHGRREIMRVDKRIASPTRGARRSGAQGASW
jgi:hypothetical protein